MTKRPELNVAVVGHTNTGKTSLMRTIMRDVHFGEVSDRPAVTRHVEGAQLVIDNSGVMTFFDTPGLEDSTGLLDCLDRLSKDRSTTGIQQIHTFLASDAAHDRFSQEAKALRQLLASDVALYVVDARDRVLPKFRDELEILSRSARPVVPVLNFIATNQSKTTEWRAALAELNLHAVAEFDTVVFDHVDERRLFEKMRTLLDAYQPLLDAAIERQRKHRQVLIDDSCSLIADLLVDVAAFQTTVSLGDPDDAQRHADQFKKLVCQREQRCVDDLLQLHRFRAEDYATTPLPISEGRWGPDLFSPAALKQFGIRTGGGAAAGAATGLALDVMFGGLSLGAWTALGASIGAGLGVARTHARRMIDRARGYSELRCDENTLTLLLVRQFALVDALLRRGHGAVSPIDAAGSDCSAKPQWADSALELLGEARITPGWSSLVEPPSPALMSAKRAQLVQHLAGRIGDHIARRMVD